MLGEDSFLSCVSTAITVVWNTEITPAASPFISRSRRDVVSPLASEPKIDEARKGGGSFSTGPPLSSSASLQPTRLFLFLSIRSTGSPSLFHVVGPIRRRSLLATCNLRLLRFDSPPIAVIHRRVSPPRHARSIPSHLAKSIFA